MSYGKDNNYQREHNQREDKQYNLDFLAEMVERGIDNEFLEKAKKFVEENKQLNTTQIRRIFGQVKKIEPLQDPDKFLPLLLMLKPLLEYTAKRNKPVGNLKEVLIKAIDRVYAAKDDKNLLKVRFQRFCKGFEAIIAYHRAEVGS